MCLQTEWHLRQALNGSVIQGMSKVGWDFLLPVVLWTVETTAAALPVPGSGLQKGAGHLFCNL